MWRITFLGLLAATAYAQFTNPIIFVNANPTGAGCIVNKLYINRVTGDMLYGLSGTCTKINVGSGSGITSFNGLNGASQSVVNDTNVTWTSVGSTHTIGFTGTLAAARLNANVVQSASNDTNVTGVISAQNFTLGWTGALSVARGGLGGSLAATGGLHQFLRQNGVGANITVVQPACADLSDSVASCNTDATNAANIGSGTLPPARLNLTTNGDLLTVAAGILARIAIGANGQCLVSNGSAASWGSCATGSIGGSGSAITYAIFNGAATIANGHLTEDAATNQISASTSIATPAPSPQAFSQNPTFDLATCNRCEMAQMTNNVNSVTFTHPKPGLKFSLTMQNGTSGGFTATGYTLAGGTVTNVCGLSPAANVRTTQNFEIASDGLTIRGLDCPSDETASTLRGTERAAPSDTPAASAVTCWPDSTDHAGLECRANGSTNTFKMVLSGVDINPLTGQVTGSHFSSPLPTSQGGSGTGGTLTGFLRGGNPFSAGELTGDAFTSGNYTVINLRVNGVVYPANPSLHSAPIVTATNSVTYRVIPDCHGTNQAINYTQSTDTPGCATITGGTGTGTVTNPIVVPQSAIIMPLGLSTTGTVTIASTSSPTSVIGATYQGSSTIPSGYWLGRTIVARATGAYSTTGAPTFAVTMTIAGTTVATFTVTTPNGASSVGWEIECRSSPANTNPLTTVNSTCRFWDASGTRGFNSQTVSSLNFATAQAVDVLATWGTPSSSNTATIYNASLAVN